MEVSIIIVNYNTYSLLKDCIYSIKKYVKGINYEIIVIDNNSPNRDIEDILTDFTDINFIQNNKNSGFGIANNLGATNSKGKYILFLNPDTIFLNNAVQFFYNFCELNNNDINIGCVGSMLLDKNFNINASYSNSFGNFYQYILHFIIESVGLGSTKKLNDDEDFKKVAWVSGANMFILKETFINVGGFDRNFFMYFEDEEIQRRLASNGYSNFIIRGPQIIHYEGSGVTEYSLSKRKIIDESKVYYYRKYSNSNVVFFVQFYFYKMLVFLKLLKNKGLQEACNYFRFLSSISK